MDTPVPCSTHQQVWGERFKLVGSCLRRAIRRLLVLDSRLCPGVGWWLLAVLLGLMATGEEGRHRSIEFMVFVWERKVKWGAVAPVLHLCGKKVRGAA
jgi:hypothetical protein